MPDRKLKHIPYLPHTEEDRQEMLRAIGVKGFEELISHIPKDVRAQVPQLSSPMSELELSRRLNTLAAKNKPASSQACFLGGGSYRRFVPAVVNSIISRSEFSTAYTPYQPEVSQGSLQVIYEFQTAICLLTGMEVANASLYDGPTACAEAALMSARLTNRTKIVISDSVNPEYRMVTQTYAGSGGLSWQMVPCADGITEPTNLNVDQDTACVIVQYPNFFGCLEDLGQLSETAHRFGALLVVITEPISLGLLTPPALFGADIVIGDAQPCGNSLSFGGPSGGYIACRKDFVRQLPGRLCGMTVDNHGQRAFTLTLQTREQHIRRAKATSNICTNQALNALAMLVYLVVMGPEGLKELANLSVQQAHYLCEGLSSIKGVQVLFNRPFFNEFAISLPVSSETVLNALKEKGILGGLSLSTFYGSAKFKDSILVAVTEMNSQQELDNYVQMLGEIIADHDTLSPTSKNANRAPLITSNAAKTDK
jgi:glycine dehydrogenase subunit 1